MEKILQILKLDYVLYYVEIHNMPMLCYADHVILDAPVVLMEMLVELAQVILYLIFRLEFAIVQVGNI